MCVFGTRSLLCTAAVTFIAIASAPVAAQQDGRSNGRDLANVYCSGCRDLTEAKGREQNARYGQSFPAVANTPHLLAGPPAQNNGGAASRGNAEDGA